MDGDTQGTPDAVGMGHRGTLGDRRDTHGQGHPKDTKCHGDGDSRDTHRDTHRDTPYLGDIRATLGDKRGHQML